VYGRLCREHRKKPAAQTAGDRSAKTGTRAGPRNGLAGTDNEMIGLLRHAARRQV
jgi:hypothetical protein